MLCSQSDSKRVFYFHLFDEKGGVLNPRSNVCWFEWVLLSFRKFPKTRAETLQILYLPHYPTLGTCVCMYVWLATVRNNKKERKKEKNPLIEMSLITRYSLKQDMYKKSIQMSLSLSHTHTLEPINILR